MGRYLGQHFLKNKAKLKKIVDALDLKDSDIVIEIGPGKGALTGELRIKNAKCRIIAIEKDKNLVEFLRKKYKGNNIEIIEGDALKEIKNQISKIKITNKKSKIIKNLKIVGNIPYYITGYLFRILGELEIKPELIVLLIQKEVAERICAKSSRMNLLAASAQFWAELEIIGYVSKKDFSPPPKVDSAIIKLKPKKDLFDITLCSRSTSKCNSDKYNNERSIEKYVMEKYAKEYYKFIKILFKQPRKTIVNNLLNIGTLGVPNINVNIRTSDVRKLIVEKLFKIGVNSNSRPQDLTIKQIIELSTLI